MEPTLFEKIINRDIPAEIIFEDEQSIVIKDIAPQAPTHLLIIPKKPIKMISDASDDDDKILGHLLLIAKKVAKDLKLEEAFRLVIITEPRQVKVFFISMFTCWQVDQ